MAVFVMLTGELPPRHLPGITPQSSVADVKAAIQSVFKEATALYELDYGGAALTDDNIALEDYGVPEEALLTADRLVTATRSP